MKLAYQTTCSYKSAKKEAKWEGEKSSQQQHKCQGNTVLWLKYGSIPTITFLQYI